LKNPPQLLQYQEQPQPPQEKKNTDIYALLARRARGSYARTPGLFQDDPTHDDERGQERGQIAETTPFLGTERTSGSSSDAPISQRARVVKAILYAVQNFYAFMIM
jgi:copper transporter 1